MPALYVLNMLIVDGVELNAGTAMKEVCFVSSMVFEDGLLGWLAMHPKMGLIVHLPKDKQRKKKGLLLNA